MSQSLEALITEKKVKSNILQIRSILISSIIILLTLSWLIYTGIKVHTLDVQENKLKAKVDSLKQQLHDLSSYSKFTINVNFEDIKRMYGLSNTEVANLASFMFENKDEVKFVYDGELTSDNINNGEFNSPAFMKYSMLKTFHNDYLNSLIKSKYVNQPLEHGDIIFYKTGYVMLNCGQGDSFCIGMTPLGVLTLRPDFATIEFIAHFPKKKS